MIRRTYALLWLLVVVYVLSNTSKCEVNGQRTLLAQESPSDLQSHPASSPSSAANDNDKHDGLLNSALTYHQLLFGEDDNNVDRSARLRVPIPSNCVRLYSNSPEYTCDDDPLPHGALDFIPASDSPLPHPRNRSSLVDIESAGRLRKRDVNSLTNIPQTSPYGLTNPRSAMQTKTRMEERRPDSAQPILTPEQVGKWLGELNFNADMCYDFIRLGFRALLPGRDASEEQQRQDRTRKYLDPQTTSANVAARRDAPLTQVPTGHYRVMRPNAETRRTVNAHMIMRCIPNILISSGKLPNTPETFRQLANLDLKRVSNDYIQSGIDAIDALNDHTHNDFGYEVALTARQQNQRDRRQANFTFNDDSRTSSISNETVIGADNNDDDRCVTINDFRKINGGQNNLQNPQYGVRQGPYLRLTGMKPRYKDSVHGMRNLAYRPCSTDDFVHSGINCYDGNAPLPNPKDISDNFMKNPEHIGGHEQQVSHMIVGWGQFLMHDITKVPADPMIDPRTGRGGSCLGTDQQGRKFCVESKLDARCASVCPRGNCAWKAGSPTDCIPIVRAAVKTNALGEITKFNEVTPLIDASHIYGSSSGEMSMLRESPPFDYVLKMTSNGLLPGVHKCPMMRIDDCKSSPDPSVCACCGDDRCNEHPGLTSLHTTFARYHNLLADSLFTLNGCPSNPSRPNDCWNPARTYLEARKIVAATMQQITYNEWLIWILGPELHSAFRLNDAGRATNGYEMGYQNTINPGTYLEFAAGAGRFGHSLVRLWWGCDKAPGSDGPPCQFDPSNPTGLAIPGVVETPEKRIFQFILPAEQFRSKPYYENQGQFQRIIEGMTREQCQLADEWIDESLRSQLNGPPEMDDLASINIQRCRDFGCGGYAEYAAWCKRHLNDVQTGLGDKYYQSSNLDIDIGTRSNDLHRLTPGEFPLKPEIISRLQQTYNFLPPSSWDLYPSGLAEMIVDGGLVGPTFASIIGQQMFNLKYGDRFFYTNAPINTDGKATMECGDNKAQAFTRCQLQMIREQATLSNVLCYTKSVQAVSPDPFVIPDNSKNPGRFCSTVDTSNFLNLAEHWSLDTPCRGVECSNC